MSTETVARLLARGYNEHVRAHGPDNDGAKPLNTGLTVVHEGVQYDVTIRPRYLTAGYRTWVHRTCGILGCNDPEHLVLRPAPEVRS